MNTSQFNNITSGEKQEQTNKKKTIENILNTKD